ncbi:hypothetical protein JO380_000694 [Cellulomonas iranensis]|uniref:Uncharacterized protein n=1 Tax=Cellulomonas iranensis TaxID=76862 RepID=A0ABU0GGU7_9CELL|nr:hypothetical protein [Cellulomonas iranensis]
MAAASGRGPDRLPDGPASLPTGRPLVTAPDAPAGHAGGGVALPGPTTAGRAGSTAAV